MPTDIIIGVDCGGTRTSAAAVRADGVLLGRCEGAGANFNNIGINAARDNVFNIITNLLKLCGADGYRVLVLGMSALDAPADEETARRFAGELFDPTRLRMVSDATIAMSGATLGQPGMVIICGTGSMMMLLDGGGREHVALGWGIIPGDPGGSYTLAVQGVRAAIDAWEGVGASTALTEACMSFFDIKTPRALIGRLYSPGVTPGSLADFARFVLDAARDGDKAAANIVYGNLRAVAEKAAMLIGEHPEARTVALVGGVFDHNKWARDWFKNELLDRVPNLLIGPPEFPPEIGAALIGLKSTRSDAACISMDEIIINIKKSINNKN
ncbi:MAG: hypothetical protein LBS72_01055 [Oscillospiraceae bacterium]|jgi:N-acetylglucosamine kinase-like BadF-type ATPase|nr:hypothetical protein [Oscillospiraceae bacterium]